ncbi:hydrolase, TatD family protein [Pelomyxa schiedti]|nr:hydrolase, TatD family protein [Pelomyxa schiedti]
MAKIFVGNIPYSLGEAGLKAVFGAYGTIVSIDVLSGYAFMEFETEESAIRAVEEKNNCIIDERKIAVQLSRPRGSAASGRGAKTKAPSATSHRGPEHTSTSGSCEGTGKAATAVEEPGDQPYCDSGVHLSLVLHRLAKNELRKSVTAPASSVTTSTTSASSPKATPILDLSTARELLFPTIRFAVSICVGPEDLDQYIELQNTCDWIYSAYGVHPHFANQFTGEYENKIIERMSHPRTVGWGECGLDYFKNFVSHEIQQEVFPRQMKRAIEFQKTLVVHTRDADDDTLRLMTEVLPSSHPIHMHCFTGGPEFASQIMRRFPNVAFGISGAMTFNIPNYSDRMQETVKMLPLGHIVLDTCGPYMAPVPFKGQTGHPGHIPVIASEVARLKGTSQREVLQITLDNTMRIYTIHL